MVVFWSHLWSENLLCIGLCCGHCRMPSELHLMFILDLSIYDLWCCTERDLFVWEHELEHCIWTSVKKICTVWVKKSSPPKTLCDIFTQVKYISVKFCQYVASLYLHICASFGRFIVIFNKMALIFLGVRIVFNVSVSSFLLSQIAITLSPIMSGPQFIRPQSTGLSGLEEMLESYYELQPKLKTVPKFTDAL